MDNTEGIPENEPWVVISGSKENPFGVAGRDYSAEYPVTSIALYASPQYQQIADAVIAERERCEEVLHQLTHRIAEYLYGATREQAIEWAKSDKYDSDAARAIDILDICKHAINGR